MLNLISSAHVASSHPDFLLVSTARCIGGGVKLPLVGAAVRQTDEQVALHWIVRGEMTSEQVGLKWSQYTLSTLNTIL